MVKRPLDVRVQMISSFEGIPRIVQNPRQSENHPSRDQQSHASHMCQLICHSQVSYSNLVIDPSPMTCKMNGFALGISLHIFFHTGEQPVGGVPSRFWFDFDSFYPVGPYGTRVGGQQPNLFEKAGFIPSPKAWDALLFRLTEGLLANCMYWPAHPKVICEAQ